MGGVLFDVPGCNGGGCADSQIWAVFTGSTGRKTAGAAFRRTGCRASAGRVFGMVGVADLRTEQPAAVIEAARVRVTGPLHQWGYAGGTALVSCLCEALLRNDSPHPVHLNAEALERFRLGVSADRRAKYYQLAKGLSAAGILDKPLPVAPPRRPAARDSMDNMPHAKRCRSLSGTNVPARKAFWTCSTK